MDLLLDGLAMNILRHFFAFPEKIKNNFGFSKGNGLRVLWPSAGLPTLEMLDLAENDFWCSNFYFYNIFNIIPV
jgi:hypothetical protein